MECKFCQRKFSRKSSLDRHQKESRICLVAQGKLDRVVLSGPEPTPCLGCGKCFTKKSWLREHEKTCGAVAKIQSMEKAHLARVKELKSYHVSEVLNLNTKLAKCHEEISDLKSSHSASLDQRYLQGKLHATKEINDNLIGLDLAQTRVKALEKKYLRKQPRTAYKDLYVVYIITNPDLQARQTYILGSATNLTNRLSTYNKSAEHKVIYYAKCKNKEAMKALELFILQNLSAYREQANRDRFKVPEGQTVDFFVEKLKEIEKLLP